MSVVKGVWQAAGSGGGHYSAPPTVALQRCGAEMSDLYVASPEFQVLETLVLHYYVFQICRSGGAGGGECAISTHTLILWRAHFGGAPQVPTGSLSEYPLKTERIQSCEKSDSLPRTAAAQGRHSLGHCHGPGPGPCRQLFTGSTICLPARGGQVHSCLPLVPTTSQGATTLGRQGACLTNGLGPWEQS